MPRILIKPFPNSRENTARENMHNQPSCWAYKHDEESGRLVVIGSHPEIRISGDRMHLMGAIVQYWRSFDHLEAYARSKSNSHFPAWTAFNKRMKNGRGDVGIWHETYLIKAGQYEAVYSGMPPYGLGRISELLPATGNRNEARTRLKLESESG